MSKRADLLKEIMEIDGQYSKADKESRLKLLERARCIHGKLAHRLFHIHLQICDNGYCDGDTLLFNKISVLENTVSDVAKIVKNMEMQSDDIKKSGGASSSAPSTSSTASHLFKQVDSKYDDKLPSIVMFYAEWCGHSQALLPIWSEFEKMNKSNAKVNIFKVECDKNKDLGQLFGITGFPTVLYIVKNQVPIEFAGERNLPNLVSFMENYVK